MQHLIKLMAWMAPALLLILLIILGRLDRHNAEMAAETANFDQEFSVIQQHFSTENPSTKTFWKERQSDAESRIQKASIEQARTKGIIDEHTNMIEKTLSEMETRK